MLSVVDAMNATRGFIRPMREGEELVKAKMVVSVGCKSKDNDVVHVQALVLRTSGIKSKDPAVVELWVDLSKEYGERVVNDNEEELRKHCDCPAGNSEKCKHIVAVMLILTSYEEDDLEDLSCTDIEQQWGALKTATLKEYAAKRFPDMCHVKGQRDVYVNNLPEVTESMQERWRQKLMNSCPLGEVSLFVSTLRKGQGTAACEEDAASLKGETAALFKKLLSFRSFQALGKIRQMTEEQVRDLSPVNRAFYDQYVVSTLEKSVCMCSGEQRSSAWKKARNLRLFASKARAQYTYFCNDKPDWDARYSSLYLKPFSGNTDTKRGDADEILCREKYETKMKCRVLETGALIRPEIPWLSSSPDGVVLDDAVNFVRNIEIKSFKEGTRLASFELIPMNAIPTVDCNGNVKVKNQHYAQMQLGMLLAGMETCDYCLYSSVDHDFTHIRVPFDEDHVIELCRTLVIVYFKEFLPRMVAHFNYSIGDDDDDEESGDD